METSGQSLLALRTRLVHIYKALLHLDGAFCDLFLIYFQKCSPGLPVQTGIT